jgi:RNA polymerase sigma-70 factor (ECF subfamily)
MQSFTDEEIVSKIQAGKSELFGEIIDRYENKLVSYASKLILDHDMAEDAVQEAFIKTYRDIQSFDIKRKFSSWIYRIVHNESINQVRKNSKNVDMDEVGEIASSIDIANETATKIDNQKLSTQLLEAISKLPLKYREVVMLRFYEDKSYDEISDILRLPGNTVGTYISRAKIDLKKNLNIKDIEEFL